jgi:gluconokinase
MGVSGSGKSTVGRLLANRLGADFEEGDELHPAANVAAMKAGHPLGDAERAPWLRRVADWLDAQRAAGRPGVITCSALKRRYRDGLRGPGVVFVYLEVDRAELADRLAHRIGHFMPAELLDSQLADLEPLEPDETAVTIEASGPPSEQVDRIVAALA